MNKRILFSNNGTIQDLSSVVNRYSPEAEVVDFVAAQDAIYIGSRLPFNHLFFKLSTLNILSSTMTLQYHSNEWSSVVELIDETEGFTKSGFVTFTPNRNAAWSMRSNSSEIADLASTAIYDLYWLKITFSANLSLTTAISYVGNLFSDDYDLGAEFPNLVKPSVMNGFKAGKISWEEQHVKAAELLISDLISKSIIDDRNQILVRDDYKNASVCKVAEIICGAFGDDYVEDKKMARNEYQNRLALRIHKVDKNADATENIGERKMSTGWLSR